MAEIEIGPLTDRLGDDEIAELKARMDRMGAPKLPEDSDDEVASVGDLDDDVLTEFLDRLDGNDAAAEIYLPVEFDGAIEIGDLRVGSAQFLLDVLEELKDELVAEDDEDEDEDDDDDEDEDQQIHGRELKRAWKLFFDGATAAVLRKLPLHIRA
ncbi:MAG: hypothetical protein ABI321_09145 [Polyangia bacterium]